MALKTFKPYTKSTRATVIVDKSSLWKGSSYKPLTRGQHVTGGRNNAGRITSRHMGGGSKHKFRIIDFFRKKKNMKATVDTYLKNNPLEELMRINEGGRNIKIYVKSGATASQVRELLMFMDGGKQETIIMSLTGNFDLSQISILTDKMSLPGGTELKKASKSKK